MFEKWANPFNTGKKKVATLALAVGLTLSLGTLTAFAANHLQSLQVTVDGYGAQYSTDGGKTWSDQVPEGAVVTTDANGERSLYIGTPSDEAKADVNAAVDAVKDAVTNTAGKQEADNWLYSTDDGQTWSNNAPAGVTVDAE